ncbi:hypothetical protein MC885_012166 [Smutsia gigantea]|nr:hypothetical protein MC885_012166 [Smutsia gigantea]
MGGTGSVPPRPRGSSGSLPLRLCPGDVRAAAWQAGWTGACPQRRGCAGVGEQQECVGRARELVPAAGLRRRAGRGKCIRARGPESAAATAGVRLVAGRKDAGRELSASPGSPSGRARRGSPRPPGQGRARVPATPPPLPPPASSSFPAPRACASRGTPGGAAPPRPARLAPTPPPPSRRRGRAESAGARGVAGADMDPNPRAALERQQLRLRERQKFFEDILQPETEFVFPLSHLHLESQRRSISSMEVNVDTLEQVEFIDLGDQDGADVFLPCEDPPPTPQTSGVDNHPEELGLPLPTPDRTASRTSSSSSDSSTNPHSPNPSDGGADTPLAQSDEEGDGADGEAEPGASYELHSSAM